MSSDKQNQAISQIEALLNVIPREELIRLNKMIVQRLKIIDGLRTIAANAQFMPGDRVGWSDNFGKFRQGIVIRVNVKTVSVLADDDADGHWKIHASLLTKI